MAKVWSGPTRACEPLLSIVTPGSRQVKIAL